MKESITGGITDRKFFDQIGTRLQDPFPKPGVTANIPSVERADVEAARWKGAYERALDEITYLRELVFELCRAPKENNKTQG